MTPLVSMEVASSWSLPASKFVRGCSGLGSICKIGMELMRPVSDGRSRGLGTAVVAGGRLGRRADRPLPKALRCGLSGALCTGEDLLCQLNVAFGATRSDVVGENRFSEAGCLRKANTARNYGSKDSLLEELTEVLFHLPRKIHAVVVHGKQHAFDVECGSE